MLCDEDREEGANGAENDAELNAVLRQRIEIGVITGPVRIADRSTCDFGLDLLPENWADLS